MQKYQQIESLGRCALDNSILCLVKQKQTEKYFMIKKIVLFTSEKLEQLIINQAKILKQLNHPHILKYYDILIQNDDLVEVLQFCQYGSIFQFLQKKKARNQVLSQKLLISWIMQILMALEYLNKKHIVHRLLTSENIYMNHQGDLKIGSFGKAKQLENTLQKAQTIVGTPCNLSPEMVQGGQYDSKADIWSLGCMVYHMVTFQAPFKFGNLSKLYDSIVQQPCPQLPLKYSKYLAPIYKKMMKKNPGLRPSASQLLEQQVFSKLMKQYLKRKKIDSIDLRKTQPKPLTVLKRLNMQRKSNKVLLEPLITSSRVSTKSPIPKQKQYMDLGRNTSRVKGKRRPGQNQFMESEQGVIKRNTDLPAIKSRTGEVVNKNYSLLSDKRAPQQIIKNQPNTNKNYEQKKQLVQNQQRPQLIQQKTPANQQKCIENYNQTNYTSNSTQKHPSNPTQKNTQTLTTFNTLNLQQQNQQQQYIQLLYKIKLQQLQLKYSPNMSKIFQQTAQFQTFKDLMSQ